MPIILPKKNLYREILNETQLETSHLKKASSCWRPYRKYFVLTSDLGLVVAGTMTCST
jgi:hypothetical protein